jgi:hypothetical protein
MLGDALQRMKRAIFRGESIMTWFETEVRSTIPRPPIFARNPPALLFGKPDVFHASIHVVKVHRFVIFDQGGSGLDTFPPQPRHP